jgi:DNA-binding CsgD family transcriptional regulator
MIAARLLEQYDELVGLAYSGIRETKPWQSFVECLAGAAAAQQAALLITTFSPRGDPTIVTSERAPDLTTRDYFSRVLATDTMQFVNTLIVSRPQTLDEMLTRPQWLDSALYRNFLKPRQIDHSLLVDVWRDPLALIRLGIERTAEQGDFSARERALVSRLAGHLGKSVELNGTLRALDVSCNFYRGAMDRLGIGTLFLNRDAELVDCNRSGADILHGDLGLQLLDNRLVVTVESGRRNFQQALQSLLQPDAAPPQTARLCDDSGAALLDIVGRQLDSRRPACADAGALVLQLLPCGQHCRPPEARLLRDLYQLTPREINLALALLQGHSAQQAAAQLGVSVNTVKTHLKNIFEKTGCKNQSQVIALLHRSALRLM